MRCGLPPPEGLVMDPGVYLVGTPIGNLEDVTLRALRILAAVDVLACEDTRVTRRLFVRHGLPVPARLFSCHAHNERSIAGRLIALAGEGKAVAYCTDAGMPGISDPGLHLTREAVKAGARLEAVPGPSAVVTAV
ncbi:MAG: rRNA (cytidine-2'-O-)-methyltransferase, partial [Planctomycetota bacterium]|nr:rRNA (cytidine-2'-O-)-methyltransferase [Planctomycetota bacterium]